MIIMNKENLLIFISCLISICFIQIETVAASKDICPENECLMECKQVCQNNCPPNKFCPAVCIWKEVCFCKKGYVEDENGCCVPDVPDPCEDTCPINEELKRCGRVCEPTCSNPNPEVCPEICTIKPACACKPGFVRNEFDVCVRLQQCSKTCPKNEHLNRCGRVCEPTCLNPNPRVCPKLCTVQPECTCDDGFVRNQKGFCVEAKQCGDTKCPTNQTYTFCGSSCPKTCNPRRDAQIACPAVCLQGCFCSKGYVSSEKYGCILPKDCPNEEKCFANEVFNYCGTACPKTCKNLGALIKCTANCVEGCFCEEGYVKSEVKGCVKPDQCPLEETCTKPHEKFYSNGTLCERTCKNFWNYTCSHNQFGPVCLCDQGYVRNEDGFCVLPENCTPDLCPEENEHYECGSACDEECGKIGEICSIVNVKCNDDCYCNKGYARNKWKVCIKIEKCPKKS